MQVAIGADHAGVSLKSFLVEHLEGLGYQVADLGTHSEQPVDYPDSAAAVGEAVRSGAAERGIAVCGSGAGTAIAANKLPGIRAAVAHDHYTAHQMVEHDDVNLLCLGARVVGQSLAAELAETFLTAVFSGEERHLRRLQKIHALEKMDKPVTGPPASTPPQADP